MGLRLADKWLWDFWFAQDGPDYHVFYLQADRSPGDPERRHWQVSIGHAVSQDLQNWELLPDALRPSNPVKNGTGEAWDDYTTWTGSIIQHEGRWHLFYTGSKRSESGLVQRIGLATSEDLLTWHKHPDNPLIEADPRWYELLDLESWHDQAWRDPWVFRYPVTGQFHAFITARAKNGPADARGVIGHARSSDLLRWEVLPPVTDPGDFGHMEVPQVVAIEGRYYLLYSVPAEHYSAARRRRTGDDAVTGMHYLVADDPLGPYHREAGQLLIGDTVGLLYSGKLIRGTDERWYCIAFHNLNRRGEFVGALSDPMSVTMNRNGKLSVETVEC